MSFPYMNPQSLTFTPANVSANVTMLPLFCPTQGVTITGVTLTSDTAYNSPSANMIQINIVELANSTNKVATLILNQTSNLVANTPRQFTLNTSLVGVLEGTVLGLNFSMQNEANTNLGAVGTYQIDYVQGSPGSEG